MRVHGSRMRLRLDLRCAQEQSAQQNKTTKRQEDSGQAHTLGIRARYRKTQEAPGPGGLGDRDAGAKAVATVRLPRVAPRLVIRQH